MIDDPKKHQIETFNKYERLFQWFRTNGQGEPQMPTIGGVRHVVLVVAPGAQPHVRPPQPAPHQGEALPVGLHGGGGQAPPRALQRPQRLLQVRRGRQLLRATGLRVDLGFRNNR